jgi:vacuolar-type H+-ATPase subunit E/Vma4
MSQKELMEAISHQALLKTDKILEEARQSAALIIKKAEAGLEAIKEGIIERTRSSLKTEEARLVNEARLSVKKQILAVKHSRVEEVMKGLEMKLDELPRRKDYPAIMDSLLQETLDGVSGPVTVRCRAADRKLVEGWLAKAGFEARIEEAPLRHGGLEITFGPEGRFIRRNTFDSRLEKIYPELLREAEHLLFGKV